MLLDFYVIFLILTPLDQFIPIWPDIIKALPEPMWSIISPCFYYDIIPVQTTNFMFELHCDWFGNIWGFQILRLVYFRPLKHISFSKLKIRDKTS